MKYLIPAILLMLPYMSTGQKTEIQWGTPTNSESFLSSYIPLGWHEGNFYTVQMAKNNGYLMSIGNDLNLENQKELISGQKKFEADEIYFDNGQLYMLSSEFEGKEKRNYVRATTFSSEGKIGKTKLKKIAAIAVEKNSERSDFRYYFSRDSSLLLMVHMHDMSRKDLAHVSITVAETENLENEWSVSVDLPYENQDVHLLAAGVSNDGEVILLTSIKGDEGKKLERFETHLFAFNDESKNYDDKKMKLEDKYISNARVSYTDDDKLIMTGFYNGIGKSGSNEGITGAFIATMDPDDMDDLDIHIKDLDLRTKSAIAPTSGLAKLFGLDELNAYTIQDFVVNPDGSGYAIAEQRYMRESVGQRSVTRSYYFNHLIVYRFEEDQEISWISAVPKQQVTSISMPKLGFGPLSFWYFPGNLIRTAYKYNSFVSLEKDGKIYLLYNDHAKNGNARTLKDTKIMVNKKTALATLLTMDEKGRWAKEQLFRGKDIGVILETSSTFSSPDFGFFLMAERKKDLQFGRLDP